MLSTKILALVAVGLAPILYLNLIPSSWALQIIHEAKPKVPLSKCSVTLGELDVHLGLSFLTGKTVGLGRPCLCSIVLVWCSQSIVSPIIFKCVSSQSLWSGVMLQPHSLGSGIFRMLSCVWIGSLLVRGTEVRGNVTILMTSESLKNSLFCFVLKNNLIEKKLLYYHTE